MSIRLAFETHIQDLNEAKEEINKAKDDIEEPASKNK